MYYRTGTRRLFFQVFFFFFFNEDLDLETSGLVVLDHLFLQQKAVSTLDVRFSSNALLNTAVIRSFLVPKPNKGINRKTDKKQKITSTDCSKSSFRSVSYVLIKVPEQH